MRRRDALAIHNELVKLFASSSNAVGLAFFGLGFARPLVDEAVPITPMAALYLVVGAAGLAGGYMGLGQLEADRDEADEEERR